MGAPNDSNKGIHDFRPGRASARTRPPPLLASASPPPSPRQGLGPPVPTTNPSLD